MPSLSSQKKKMTWNDLQFWKTGTWTSIKKFLEDTQEMCEPPPNLIFKPLIRTPLDKVKVVFLFPEPYCVPEKADGLALSYKTDEFVREEAPFLWERFMKELETDVGIKPRRNNLDKWCQEGVLLWNLRPTTMRGRTHGHYQLQWDVLTREILETVYLNDPKVVFVFNGESISMKKFLPDDATCMYLPFPTPVVGVVDRFRGCKPYSTINIFLKKNGKRKINWQI